ncbi:type IV pilus assembly protein PilA [Comamonas odontotermitis]|uniref:Type IV pilus assembly protein PilA n=1 Tax=Comamonas odontotermitis TaxID=379895 RepID=A0ABR6RAL4_9BURK|nr:pilin [Comamonas odontotermitis]MBB6576200.1 type IV pilus assembly protein PilA [Comamonas odontotermitis]
MSKKQARIYRLKWKLIGGFTLIELMVVVAIVGILAAIALPQYQSFTIRTKASEGLVLASDAKMAVAEAYSGGISGIADRRAEYNARSISSKYVASIQISNDAGQITITYLGNSNNGLAAINGKTLILTPSISGAILNGQSGDIDWACASNSKIIATSRGLPASTGTIDASYVPSECK